MLCGKFFFPSPRMNIHLPSSPPSFHHLKLIFLKSLSCLCGAYCGPLLPTSFNNQKFSTIILTTGNDKGVCTPYIEDRKIAFESFNRSASRLFAPRCKRSHWISLARESRRINYTKALATSKLYVNKLSFDFGHSDDLCPEKPLAKFLCISIASSHLSVFTLTLLFKVLKGHHQCHNSQGDLNM